MAQIEVDDHAAMFVYDERDRIAELRHSPANRQDESREEWFDGAALGGFDADRDEEVVPPDHELRTVVDAQEQPR